MAPEVRHSLSPFPFLSMQGCRNRPLNKGGIGGGLEGESACKEAMTRKYMMEGEMNKFKSIAGLIDVIPACINLYVYLFYTSMYYSYVSVAPSFRISM